MDQERSFTRHACAAIIMMERPGRLPPARSHGPPVAGVLSDWPVLASLTASPGRRLYWPVVTLLCYSLLTLWLLWPFPIRAGRVILHRGDPIHQLWTLRWTQHAIWHDPLQLFAANTNYPFTAALTLNQATYSNAVLVAPVQALFHNDVLTHNAAVLISFVLAGACTALLVQELTGNRWAALVAGALYAFAPVRQAHIYHLNLLSGYWTPLVLWGMHRLWRLQHERGALSSALVIGLGFAAQVLAEFYHAIYLTLALLLFGLWQLISRRWGLTWRASGLLLAAGLLGGLLILPVMVPTIHAWSILGLRRTIAEHDQYSARLENYLVTDRPMRFEYGLSQFNHHSGTSGAAEHSLYPGLLTLPLALGGLIWALRRHNRDAPLYALIALLAFVLSLGP